MPIQHIEMDLRNKTTSEFRTVFHSPLGVPNSQVSLYRQLNIKAVAGKQVLLVCWWVVGSLSFFYKIS